MAGSANEGRNAQLLNEAIAKNKVDKLRKLVTGKGFLARPIPIASWNDVRRRRAPPPPCPGHADPPCFGVCVCVCAVLQDGMLPMHVCAEKGSVEMMQTLVELNANLSIPTAVRRPHMHAAAPSPHHGPTTAACASHLTLRRPPHSAGGRDGVAHRLPARQHGLGQVPRTGQMRPDGKGRGQHDDAPASVREPGPRGSGTVSRGDSRQL